MTKEEIINRVLYLFIIFFLRINSSVISVTISTEPGKVITNRSNIRTPNLPENRTVPSRNSNEETPVISNITCGDSQNSLRLTILPSLNMTRNRKMNWTSYSYRVHYREEERMEGFEEKIFTVQPSQTTFILTNLKTNSTYEIKIQFSALPASPEAKFSESRKFMMIECTPASDLRSKVIGFEGSNDGGEQVVVIFAVSTLGILIVLPLLMFAFGKYCQTLQRGQARA